ncbi:hypothetical protein GIB67_024838 [Kingdonia uniflora]|uniref:Uncharacterized protein n=1 Tax=Kingdonia uniflora TaxID=39325 RepID=A0A7J7NYE1_9MAGN|nr:hypothetical protein GIB67_024838 [Kingdonia uniflora]
METLSPWPILSAKYLSPNMIPQTQSLVVQSGDYGPSVLALSNVHSDMGMDGLPVSHSSRFYKSYKLFGILRSAEFLSRRYLESSYS